MGGEISTILFEFIMRSPEIGLPPEVTGKKKGPKLPANETYDVSGPEKFVADLKDKPKTAEAFRKAALGRAEDIFESGHLQEKIKEGEIVLYIGAGTGHVAQHIEQQTGAKVVKFDIADLRTPDTKDRKFAKANARNLPVRDGSVDKICLFDILHHTKNQEEILKEALRVLKPGGKLLVMEDTIPEEINFGAGLNAVRAKIKKMVVGKMDDMFNKQSKGVNPQDYHPISDWELMFHDAGFDVNAEDTTSWHWGIPDFVGADRKKRPDHNTLARPFEATMFEVTKPSEEK